MDSLITAAARALATGDSLGASKRVALRDDAPALASPAQVSTRHDIEELATRLASAAAWPREVARGSPIIIEPFFEFR